MKIFRRRSLMFLPTTVQSYYDNLNRISCDGVIFDLEDSIPEALKGKARHMLRAQFDKFQSKDCERIIRINDCRSDEHLEDLQLIQDLKPDTVMVSKAEYDDVCYLEGKLKKVLKCTDLTFLILVETLAGYFSAEHMLKKSDKISGVVFGAEDFSADMGIHRIDYHQNPIYFHVISNLILLAKYHGIDFIDSVYPYLSTDDSMRSLVDEATTTKKMGANGKLTVHPSQVDIINKLYSPDYSEIEKSKEIIKKLQSAENAKGLSVIQYNNRMVDKPEKKRLERLMTHVNRFSPPSSTTQTDNS